MEEEFEDTKVVIGEIHQRRTCKKSLKIKKGVISGVHRRRTCKKSLNIQMSNQGRKPNKDRQEEFVDAKRSNQGPYTEE
jgi:hypothetical protein